MKPSFPHHGPYSRALDAVFPTRVFRSFDRVEAGGLPQHTIHALLQDDEGVLWIATFDGVATFDGGRIRSLPEGRQVPWTGSFYALARRRGGGVYAGGEGGIFVLDGRSWRRWATPAPVASLAEGSELWMVDETGHLWRRDSTAPSGWRAVTLGSEIGPAVEVTVDAGGSAWVAGRTGVARLEAGGAQTVIGGGPPRGEITAVLVARSGTCWIGTAEGSVLFASPGSPGWRRVDDPSWSGGRISSLGEDRRGRIWAGGLAGSLSSGREGGGWSDWGPENGLKASTVTSILADREGTLWIGYLTNGLQQWIGESWTHRIASPPARAGTGRLVVTGISGTSDGGFLAAVFDQGIWRWNGRTLRRFGREAGLTEDARFAVEPRPGEIWVGTRFGIFEWRGGRFQHTLELPSGLVTGIFAAPDGSWLAASSTHGILRRSEAGWLPADRLNVHLPSFNVRGMTWRHDGTLWVATSRGVAVFGREHHEVLPVDPVAGMPRAANTVLEVGDDEVWVGAFGGIAIWQDGKWRVLTEADGIPGRTIYALRRAPDGAIWATGSGGVGRFAHGGWTVWDTHNGLIDNECNVNALWIAPDGSVLVGTMGSMARWDPWVSGLPAPPLRLFWRQLAGEPDGEGRVHLPAGSPLEVTWSVPWLGPRRVEFRTRVPRLRPEWSEVGRTPRVALENLRSGRWHVEVEARLEGTGERGWSEPSALDLTIAPYVWERSWFRALLMLAGVLVVVGLVRLRTWKLQRRAQELERRVDESLARIKVLRGLLPICASCRKVRDDQGYWREIEAYVRDHSEADFSHGLCPGCMRRLYPDFVDSPDRGLRAGGGEGG